MDHLSAGKDLARVLHKSAASALKRAPRTHRMCACVFDCGTQEHCAHTVCVSSFFVLSNCFSVKCILFFCTGVTQEREKCAQEPLARTHRVWLIADTALLPTSDGRIVLKKLAEEVASFKCALSYNTRLEQPVVWLFLVICVDCVTVTI